MFSNIRGGREKFHSLTHQSLWEHVVVDCIHRVANEIFPQIRRE